MTKSITAVKMIVPDPDPEEEIDANLLTPNEAEALVCPSGIGGEPVSRNGFIVGKRCIGDLCMAWRWADEEVGYCGLIGIE